MLRQRLIWRQTGIECTLLSMDSDFLERHFDGPYLFAVEFNNSRSNLNNFPSKLVSVLTIPAQRETNTRKSLRCTFGASTRYC